MSKVLLIIYNPTGKPVNLPVVPTTLLLAAYLYLLVLHVCRMK